MKLWLDDVRKPPNAEYEWCKDVESALAIAAECEEWGLDHDLGGQLAHYGKGPYDWAAPTGETFCNLVVGMDMPVPDRITIHSTNTIGVCNMVIKLSWLAVKQGRDIEIIVRPMQGKVMDKTPFYEEALR